MTINAWGWLDDRIPRGSIVRFSLAGGFNSFIFYVFWAALIALLTDADVRILWGVCWGVTGVLAHFVHRWFTFDDRKSVKWTLSTAVPVYVASLVGSSMSIGWLSTAYTTDVRLMGLLNLLAWGLIVWLLMRLFVFQYSPTEHASQEHRTE